MQNILIILHPPPYGSERCLSALRLTNMLAGRDDQPKAQARATVAMTMMAVCYNT